MRRVRAAMAALLLGSASVIAAAPAHAQERGAIALAETVEGLGNTMRVLMIGAHPDDEDTQLLARLARGRHVHTAYLSLTRGDGGQNLIGNELGEALGAIRTEELLAARRVDGAEQFFTRAYDFGFSKTAEETYRHWPKDTLLGDVVRVVRAFRPHVIVAVFSGTPRDGHGHHQVSGLLAREAYEVAGDSARYPRAGFGAPWTPLKLYRSARFDRESGTLAINVGEYDPVLGRSYAEIAGESRSQHKSQGFGALERRGEVLTYVRREASRVDAPEDARAERSMFAGIDTTWGRLRAGVRDARVLAALDSVPAAVAAVQAALDVRRPSTMLPALGRLARLLGPPCPVGSNEMPCGRLPGSPPDATYAPPGVDPDLERTVGSAIERTMSALQLATGLAIEAELPVDVVPMGGTDREVPVRLYNRGSDTVGVRNVMFRSGAILPLGPGQAGHDGRIQIGDPEFVAPGANWVRLDALVPDSLTQPWWLVRARVGDMFAEPVWHAENRRSPSGATAAVWYSVPGSVSHARTSTVPLVRRYADPVRGDVSRPVAIAPAISVTLDRPIELAPANADLRRTVRVRLQSAQDSARRATVRLTLPGGLRADSTMRTVILDPRGIATAEFTVTGRIAPGRDTIRAVVESDGATFSEGYTLVDYEHIHPQRLYRPAATTIEAVDVQLPENLRVAYIPGVGDNVAPMLRQLGVPLTVVEPDALATTDLSRFTTVVVGPRAYEAHPQVMANRARLLDFARAGGTLVVQYQQYEVQRPGVAPYPMTVNRPHDRVTVEESPVRILDAASPVLAGPNRIALADFDGWVQERSLYMPRTFDERYAAPLELQEPGEEARRSALLVAPVGRGTYVYVTLSLFRQLPAGVPGAARLFVNLLAAGQGGGTRP